jgi:hypothetical protein
MENSDGVVAVFVVVFVTVVVAIFTELIGVQKNGKKRNLLQKKCQRGRAVNGTTKPWTRTGTGTVLFQVRCTKRFVQVQVQRNTK